MRWQERGRRFCRLERDLPTPSSHPVCLCVAQQQALDCASLFKPQRRLLWATATWALVEGHGAAVGPARARVEPVGDPGCAVRARPVCGSMGRVGPGRECAEAAVRELVGSHEGITLGLGAACARVMEQVLFPLRETQAASETADRRPARCLAGREPAEPVEALGLTTGQFRARPSR